MAKIYDDKINKNTDWGGDSSTGNLPVSGRRVQEFIKDSLNSKMGTIYYDLSSNRYLIFADSESRDTYLSDPTQTDLIMGTFDAPFNYTAEINLKSSAYNAVSSDSTGNYIEFTFDVKNKQGNSTGENVTVTYTIIRGTSKEVISQNQPYGATVRFNIDEYLKEGQNTIIVGITGQSTLAATTASITYQVVKLSITDDIDISKIYDLSSGSTSAEISYTVEGYGTKTIEWYLDYQQIEYNKDEDEVVESKATRTKYISLDNLNHGVHTIEYRAYTIVNGEKFYTDILHREVIVKTNTNTAILAAAFTINKEYGFTTDIPRCSLVQYVPYTLRVAGYSPTGSQEVTVTLDNEKQGAFTLTNDNETTVTITPKATGLKELYLQSTVLQAIMADVKESSRNIKEITDGLEFNLNTNKSNTSSDKDTIKYNDITGTLTGFNWNNTSGWVNNRLLLSEGAKLSLNYAPLGNNVTNTGKTIELEFKTINVKNDDAIICDLRSSNGTGILITATKVQLISKNGVKIETQYKANEDVRIAFVINRKSGVTNKCLSFIYTNGIISRGETWSELDSYTSDTKMVFKATNEVQVSIKSIRIYNNALTSDQILNNYMLYRDTVAEMTSIYDRNDIFYEGTTTFNPDKMSNRLPVMMITGNIPLLENTKNKNLQITVNIDYTNIQDPTRSFKMVNAAMRPQGTSSMGYPKKNFRIYTQKLEDTILYDYQGNEVSDKLYSFKEKSIPVNTWCLKADYAESSGTHNTGIARLWNKALYDVQVNNEYVCRTNAQKAALTSEYPYDVRTAVDGFPILLFYRLSESDEPIFIGKYNFNNDKSTEKVFGFTDIPGFDNSKMQCWEVLNNGSSIALFNSIEDFDNKWSEAFESRYPDTENPSITDLKNFCTWMNSVTQEDFKTQKYEHFNIYMMAAYYIYLLRHAAADQFVKNAMFTSEDGQHFYYILYDNDTINGVTNDGRLQILPSDTRESKDDSGAYLFAGHDSRLWNMLEADEDFMSIVRTVDKALNSAGITYANAIKMFDEEQADKWVERVYNQDAQYKYISPFTKDGTNNLFMLQGKRDIHRKWWLSKRFSIYDAKFITGSYEEQAVELKCINGTPAGQSITITSGYPMEYGYGINSNPKEINVYLNVGESHTFTTTEVVNLGDPIRVYNASNLQGLDISKMADKLSVITIDKVYDEVNGSSLTTLKLGDHTSINSNKIITSISGLKQAINLEVLDISGYEGITSLDLSVHNYLKELYAIGSKVASITFAKGAPLQKLALPKTMSSLVLEQLPKLQYSEITLEKIDNITDILIKSCPYVSNNFDFIYNWVSSVNTSDCTLYIDNVNWKDVDVEQLIELGNLRSITLKGKCVLNECSEDQANQLMTTFGSNVFESTSEFYIQAPPMVILSAPTKIKEGSTAQVTCTVIGSVAKKTSYSITSGSNSSVSINANTGLITVKEGYGRGTIAVQATVITEDLSTVAKSINIQVLARVYPNSNNSTINGDTSIEDNSVYTIATTETVDGEYTAEWSLSSEFDEYVDIKLSNMASCTLTVLKLPITAISGTLTYTVIKKYDSSTIKITKNLTVANQDIAETDAGICSVLYKAGLCANENYITKEEAALITADDLQPGSSTTTSIFYKYYNPSTPIKSFSGFQYFISVTTIKPNTFYGLSYLDTIIIPANVKTIGSYGISGGICNIEFLGDEIEFTGISAIRLELTETSSTSLNRSIKFPDTVKGIIYIDYNGAGEHINLTIEGGKTFDGNFKGTIKLDSYIAKGMKINFKDTVLNYVISNPTISLTSGFYLDSYLDSLTQVSTIYSNITFKDGTTKQDKDITLYNDMDRIYTVNNKGWYYTFSILSNKSDAQFKLIYYKNNANGVGTEEIVNPGTHTIDIDMVNETTLYVQPQTTYDNFTTPANQQMALPSRGSFNRFDYKEICNFYIEHIDGTLYTGDEWTSKGFANNQANGVACVRPDGGSFVVNPVVSQYCLISKMSSDTIKNLLSQLSAYTKEEVYTVTSGEQGTKTLLSLLSGVYSKDSALSKCTSITWNDGTTEAYLPSYIECALLYQNNDYITLSKLIGGYIDIFSNNYFWLPLYYKYPYFYTAYCASGGIFISNSYQFTQSLNTFFMKKLKKEQS